MTEELPATTDVVIVGAGPTGLSLACVLAERVVSFTDRATRMATLRTAGSRAMRNAAISVISRIPPVRRWLATELAGLRNR